MDSSGGGGGGAEDSNEKSFGRSSFVRRAIAFSSFKDLLSLVDPSRRSRAFFTFPPSL
jgi:hypothetical protein